MVCQDVLPVSRAPPVSGSGAMRLSLEPADGLADLAPAIDALSREAAIANPFFLPAFLRPAIAALGSGAVDLLCLHERDRLVLFAPVSRQGIAGRLTRAARVWTHPFAPLGLPLVAGGREDAAAEALLAGLSGMGRPLLVIPDMPLASTVASALARAASALGASTFRAAVQARPILNFGADPRPDVLERATRKKTRKELARQRRRLEDIGAVRLDTARGPAGIDAALDIFAAIEASGWKGRRGTAMAQHEEVRRFAQNAVAGLAAGDAAAIDLLRVGERPVAALVRLRSGRVEIPWKIAYAEDFAAFSPGAQIMAEAMRAWAADAGVTRVDPVCDEGNPLLAHLWADSEPYGTLVLARPGCRLAGRLMAARHDAERFARRRVRALRARLRH